MGKVLVFLYDTMAEFEISLATHFVSVDAGREIVPISYDGKPRTSMANLVYQPALAVEQALTLDDIDGLIIPGGMEADFRPELGALIKRLDGEGRLLAAICAGPHLLAKAGVLAGRRYTTTVGRWSDEHRCRFGGDDPFPRATLTGAKVERDGHIITALDVGFVEFAVTIADFFGVYKTPAERVDVLNAYRGLGD